MASVYRDVLDRARNGILRPGADHTYASGDDRTWMEIDWPSLSRDIGMPYDDLHCSFDKVSRARELGIELLIDDSPVNLSKALAAGMTAATLLHPWNEDICEEEDIVCAPDWPTLRARLRPLLEEAGS